MHFKLLFVCNNIVLCCFQGALHNTLAVSHGINVQNVQVQKQTKKFQKVYEKEQHILLNVSRKLQKLFKNSFCKDVRE